MVQRKKYVAILTNSPALSSIIAMVLDCEEHLNVLTFNRVENLKCHARIAPLDLIIADYSIGQTYSTQLAIDLRRANPNRRLQIILLAAHLDDSIAQACKFANIDEIIAKPMSPLFVRDRVIAQLEKPVCENEFVPRTLNQSEQRNISADNIVHLYARDNRGHQPQDLLP